jgi:hypothetical protein
MKKALIASILFTSLFCLSANAQDSSATGAGMPASSAMTPSSNMSGHGGMMGGSQPCKKLMEACKAAGFVKGQAQAGKNIMKDCMKPLMTGQSVSGVTVDAGDIQACQAKHHGHAM